MKLIYDGKPAYHPATGLDLIPGECEYADDKAEQLLAVGLRKVDAPPPAASADQDKPPKAKASAIEKEK